MCCVRNDILLVEDNHGDVRLIEQAFETRELPGALNIVRTGDEALDRLYRRDELAEAPRPELVLLGPNLPSTGGHTVPEEITADPDLRRLPVIVPTSSKSEDDLITAYEQGADACLRKPVDPVEFEDHLEAFAEFWVSAATLPPAVDDGESH